MMKKIYVLVSLFVLFLSITGCSQDIEKANEDYSFAAIYNGTWVDRTKIDKKGHFVKVKFEEKGSTAELTIGLKSKDNQVIEESHTTATMQGNGDGPFTIKHPDWDKPAEGTISLREDEIVLSIKGVAEEAESTHGLRNGTMLYEKVDYKIK
ncbi:hypothetical protein [Metabacillus arenae]|uniref:Lipoprotein n=1 Tax=Metabacillus arenae TaxID=2771434 RepID=A0A926NHT7_9BACI|nr:hypothetical protein [Metabacillus arenae]MBD1380273.1 hypothetical protein [Metabacillus arenae]